MKTIVLLLGIAIASPLAIAQMYKWVDKDGKTHYTDSPPPEDAKNLAPPKASSATAPAVAGASTGRRDAPAERTRGSSQPAEQGTKVVEHANVGVRFSVPADWDWSERPGGISVNCAPRIESRPGMPGCYFVVQKSRLAAGQTAITDADRVKWKGWAVGEGLGRVFVSAKDVRLAGHAAHEILVREGPERNAALSMRLIVLIPDRHFVDVMHYAWWDDADQSAATRPAVRAALETLKPTK